MLKVLVGSRNSAKLRATKRGFVPYFGPSIEIVGFGVISKVSPQPWGDELFIGAENRAKAVFRINKGRALGASYFVGIESGLWEMHDQVFVGGVVCILNQDQQKGFATAPFFPLPDFFLPKIREGVTLGEILERFQNLQQKNGRMGAVGFLSQGVLSREDIYAGAVSLALLPFIRKEIYFEWTQI